MKKFILFLLVGVTFLLSSCETAITPSQNSADADELMISQTADSSVYQHCIVLKDKVIILQNYSINSTAEINGKLQTITSQAPPLVIKNYDPIDIVFPTLLLVGLVVLIIGLITSFD